MQNQHTYKLIIIGSGPAGYTAAIYAARGGLKPLVLAGPQPGGQLTTTTTVENFPGFPEGIQGYELISNMQKQAERFGATIQFETATKVDFSATPKKIWVNEKLYTAPAVIITTGSRSRTLGLDREQELWNKGIHTCATCDGFFYKDKTVAVIGGGDSAMEESSFLSKVAKKVYIIHRKDSFKASKIMQQRTRENKKIEILWNTEITKYLGEKHLTGLELFNNQTNVKKTMEIDALFFAIGHIPNTDIFKGQIDLHEQTGYIAAQDNVYTNIEGVFAGGDCVDHIYRQAVSAAGLGCMAQIAAERWLQKNISLTTI